MSLLPNDPAPFTMPNTSSKRSEQPQVSLADYPLPDGDWRWVSKSWMIDMRSDSGEVQHDGFEYNWMFRTHKWRPEVSALSAGGWVRRRRWVRLMMRPGKQRREKVKRSENELGNGTPSTGTSLTGMLQPRNRHSVTSSFPPSVVTRNSNPSSDLLDLDVDAVWFGEDAEEDWSRCHLIMKRLGRDGRKLELWKCWLGAFHPDHKHIYDDEIKGKGKQKQWTEDDTFMPSEEAAHDMQSTQRVTTIPAKEWFVPVLRKHVCCCIVSLNCMYHS